MKAGPLHPEAISEHRDEMVCMSRRAGEMKHTNFCPLYHRSFLVHQYISDSNSFLKITRCLESNLCPSCPLRAALTCSMCPVETPTLTLTKPQCVKFFSKYSWVNTFQGLHGTMSDWHIEYT